MNRNSGFTLLEVLVSVFVFAIGTLGLAAMQITAKRSIAEAGWRSAAAFAQNDLMERARLAGLLGIRAMAALGAEVTDIDQFAAPQYPNQLSPEERAAGDLRDVYAHLFGEAVRNGESYVGGINSPALCIRFQNDVLTSVVAWRGYHEFEQTAERCGAHLGKFRRISVLSVPIRTDL